MSEGAPRRWLALGDSYTIGEGVSPADRWPSLAARALRAMRVPVEDPEIIARTGWTCDELNAAIDAAAPQGPYAVVTLLIGVNDQYRGGDPASYRARFRALFDRAAAFAGARPERVLVLSIPDWGVTPFAEGRDRAAIAAAIDAFNAVNAAETAEGGGRYVDVTTISRQSHPDWVTEDGLHPSATQYFRWVTAAGVQIARMLATP